MKRLLSLLCIFTCILSLTGCNRITQEQYDAVCAERDDLRAELAAIENNPEELVTVDVGGSFVACVRHVIPDYCLDGTTPRVAVVTIFQGGPFVVRVDDLADQLEIDRIYRFVLETRHNVTITRSEYEKGWLWPEVGIPMYNLGVASVRPAKESELGLDGVHEVTYTLKN